MIPSVANTEIRLPIMYPEIRRAAYITPESGRRIRTAVRKLAAYFRRGNEYDFTQFCIDDKTPHMVHVFHRKKYNGKNGACGSELFGAVCFREYSAEHRPPTWYMQWAWLHPYFRNKGILKEAWPQFLKDFGEDFYVDPPVSPAMLGFLQKHATASQREAFSKMNWPAFKK